MQFFVDTANLKEIQELSSWGVVDGVTTNPSLIAKENGTQKEIIENICKIIDGPVSAEVLALDLNGMLKEAGELAKIHDNVVIKLPLTLEGLKATKALSSQGVKTNVTLCFSANQALLAAKNGATYVSPFIGRLDDIGQTGMDLIREMRVIYDNFGFETQILSASIRHADHVKESAMNGADVATIPFNVLSKLVHHPLTDSGLAQFLKDHEKSQR
jgi:transaldolase